MLPAAADLQASSTASSAVESGLRFDLRIKHVQDLILWDCGAHARAASSVWTSDEASDDEIGSALVLRSPICQADGDCRRWTTQNTCVKWR